MEALTLLFALIATSALIGMLFGLGTVVFAIAVLVGRATLTLTDSITEAWNSLQSPPQS